MKKEKSNKIGENWNGTQFIHNNKCKRSAAIQIVNIFALIKKSSILTDHVAHSSFSY